MKIRYVALLSILAVIPATRTKAQTAADSSAIVGTALDYIEGWYEGNADRMERALHPDLAKRIVNQMDSGSTLGDMTAEMLVGAVRRGGGRNTPEDRVQKDVTVLDVYEGMASVKIVAGDWVDYLHVARWNHEWKIINVLWAMKPR